MARRLSALGFAIISLNGISPLRADWRDGVGYNRLLQTYSAGVPTSVTGGVTQVEAPIVQGDPINNYLPDSADSRFTGKTIVNKSPGSGASGHATAVGVNFYGTGSSLIPGTTAIDAYNANTWINAIPFAEPRLVENHSWIVHTLNANNPPEAVVPYYNALLDYMVNAQGFVCVAGVNNGYSTTLPYLLGQGYNLISVGLSSGQHSAGFTAYDGVGRIKPDIVAPDTLTSFATPQVSSAAGLLAQKLTETPYLLSGADLPRTVKALLLAGATKEGLASWNRSATQPIDTRYGAGQLNILLAYRALVGGRVTYGQLAPNTAWTNSSVHSSLSEARRTYYFDVPAGSASPRFSAALVWHRSVVLAPDGYSTAPLPDLNLALYNVDAGAFTLGSVVQTSASAVDNLEHIYAPDLPAGRYALQVTTNSVTSTDYALAWRTQPAVTVAATAPAARELDGAPGLFTVTRTGPATSPLLVPLTWGGTAVSGTHYTAPPATLLIAAGSASATVAVAPISDSSPQGDRTVTLSLASDYSLSAGSPSSATVTIQDKPYDAWRFAYFASAQLADPLVSGETADPDGDGLANLLEYALGADPLAPDAAARQPSASLAGDGRLTLTYFQPSGRADLTYAVEWTDDLAVGSWQSGASAVTEIARVATAAGGGDAAGEWVTVRANAMPSASARQFLRLRVTRQ